MSLFSWSECEQKTPDGEVMCDSVVMDDAATGMLGELPKFERWTKTVQSV